MERSLVHIEEVLEVAPIKGADFIEQIHVLGWSLVAKKDEFKPGDRCVFFEIDSILPEKPEFEFMRKSKFRIRTIRLRQILSQGLALPLSILPDGEYALKQDVTDLVGVTKYEPPVQANCGDTAGSFPHHVSKTDEMRIQAFPELLDELRGKDCYVTLKHDGTSATYVRFGDEVWVCSRTLAKKDGDNVYWQMNRKYGITDKLLSLPGNFAVQGEICGPGIQKNRLGLKEHDLFVFNVYDVDKGRHLDYADFLSFCQEHGLKTVVVLDENFQFNHTLEQLLELAKGKYNGTKNDREGIVIRPKVGCYSKCLQGRLSVKVINNDYLLGDQDA